MRDISGKSPSVRTARAGAVLKVSPRTIRQLKANTLPKGDPLPVAKVAAIQAAKNTSHLIPYCHPLLIEYADCRFEIRKESIHVETRVKAVYTTGVEMEALAAASAAVLTLYDMMKAVDPGMEIKGIRLLEKTGGKSDWSAQPVKNRTAAVLVLSDSVSRGTRKDTSGPILKKGLEEWGFRVTLSVIPDDRTRIEARLKEYVDRKKVDLVITTGGTGLGPRDVAPEATSAVLDRDAQGIAELLRADGRVRTPFSMLSRGRAGVRHDTLIINVPGSPGAARDAVRSLFPTLPHALAMLAGKGHRPHRKR